MKSRLLALCGGLTLSLWISTALAQNGKPPTVKEVMKKINYRDTALTPTVGKELRADPPNWDEVQRDARLLMTYVEALAKNDPPQGDKASWEQMTRAYIQGARELDAAAQKKDRSAAQAAHAKIANPAHCNSCHKVHRN
jgi:hypothetical protein